MALVKLESLVVESLDHLCVEVIEAFDLMLVILLTIAAFERMKISILQ